MRTALINNNIVENLIEANPIGLEVLCEAIGCDYLIPVDETVIVGHFYDAEKSIFTDENGTRVYPPKTNAERITELENQLVDTQAALIELAGIVGGADNGNG